MSKSIIFYGAGQNAKTNYHSWIEKGLKPVCFVDSDITKHHKIFEPYYEESTGNSARDGAEVLPLLEAIGRYPDYELYLTQIPQSLKAVREFLLKLGVPSERIKFCEAHWGRCCNYLQRRLWFGFTQLKPCCYPNFSGVPFKRNLQDAYMRFIEKSVEMARCLEENKPCECDGCPELKYDIFPNSVKLEQISFYGGFKGERCNANCFYCNDTTLRQSKSDGTISIPEALSILDDLTNLESVTVGLNSGEITVSPNFDDIFSFIEAKHGSASILSNGFVFSQRIYDLLSTKSATLNVSLDAGTRNTYAKIKGVDCFDKTVENLRKYAQSGGYIELKYIFLDNVNDNEKDVDGFVNICKNIARTVILSYDTTRKEKSLSIDVHNLSKLLIAKLKDERIPVKLASNTLSIKDFESLGKLL